jgi:hypothetical protein
MWRLGRGRIFWMRRSTRRSYRVGHIQVCGDCIPERIVGLDRNNALEFMTQDPTSELFTIIAKFWRFLTEHLFPDSVSGKLFFPLTITRSKYRSDYEALYNHCWVAATLEHGTSIFRFYNTKVVLSPDNNKYQKSIGCVNNVVVQSGHDSKNRKYTTMISFHNHLQSTTFFPNHQQNRPDSFCLLKHLCPTITVQNPAEQTFNLQ